MAANASSHAALAKLRSKLAGLAGLAVEDAKQAAAPLRELVRAEFPEGKGPDGIAWKPLKARTIEKGRHNPPLTNTGMARDSAEAMPEGNSVRLTVRAYMRYHLSTGRPVFPKPGKAPDPWREAVREANRRVIRKRLGL